MQRYFKINYNQNGKQFDCLVKSEDDRFWTTVYINPTNPKHDIFVRRELASPHVSKYSTPIEQKQFESALEQAFLTFQY